MQFGVQHLLTRNYRSKRGEHQNPGIHASVKSGQLLQTAAAADAISKSNAVERVLKSRLPAN